MKALYPEQLILLKGTLDPDIAIIKGAVYVLFSGPINPFLQWDFSLHTLRLSYLLFYIISSLKSPKQTIESLSSI